MKVEVICGEYECGYPCTPTGCHGHSTGVPEIITINGFEMVLESYRRSDDVPFSDNPRQCDQWVRTVAAIVEAFKQVPDVLPDPAIPEPPEQEPLLS